MTVKDLIGQEANKTQQCPLCNHDHYCYLLSDGKGDLVKAICQWTEEPPEGWYRSATAKDGRGIFTRDGFRSAKRRGYPDFIKLTGRTLPDSPGWGDVGSDSLAKEVAIAYFYPSDSGASLGKVARKQWTDRRRVYDKGRSTKEIRPWHWSDDGWIMGKGDKQWPLYREAEAKEEILRGGYVFACGGEQAVEVYRTLGLVATTCMGGEANAKAISNRLKDAFGIADKEGLTPLLVIHPDNDLTGEAKYGEVLLEECKWDKVPAVVLDPLALWPEMPQGGDIWDWVHRADADWDDGRYLFQSLETEIDQAIERQEIDDRARKQRDRWKAPVSWLGELGYWVDKMDDREFRPKTDFDFQVERELAGNDSGGLLIQFKLAHKKGQQRLFIKNTDYTSVQKFEDAIKTALGSAVICNLSTPELKALVRVRLHEYHVNRKGKTYRLIDRVGQQEDGVWVFRDRQFTSQGQPTSEAESRWVWNEMLTGDRDSLPKPILAGKNPQAIPHLLTTMRAAFGCNFHAALLVLGYAAAGLHYQRVIAEEGAFPILNPYGDPGSGKSTAAECALALIGMHDDGMLKDVSLSAAYEKLKITGGLCYCLDDPKRDDYLDEFLKGFYNGKARVVRGKEAAFNVQRPHSPMMVTSNHACGETSAATKSRLISLWFRKAKDGDPEAWRELPRAKAAASGALTDLIALGYDRAEIVAIEEKLVKHLPYAHARIAKSLALVAWYAEAVCRLAGMESEIPRLYNYLITTVCPGSNDPDEAGDSLRDFIDKLFILQSQNKVGDWNMRWIEKRDEVTMDKVLAIYLPGVWSVFDREFKPAYSEKVIKALIREQGVEQSRQKFHRSEDESKAYYRLLINAPCDSEGVKGDIGQPETTVRFCYELPSNLLREFSDKKRSTEINSPENDPETQMGEDKALLISFNLKDQQRSTEINREAQIGLNFSNPVDPVDLCLHFEKKQINSDIDYPVEYTAPKSGPVDLLIEKNDDRPVSDLDDPYTNGSSSMTNVPVESLPLPSDLADGDPVWVYQPDGGWREGSYDRAMKQGILSPLKGGLHNGHRIKFGVRDWAKVTIYELRRFSEL